MRRILFVIPFVFALHFNCIAQKEIIYEFEAPVSDSIKSGIKMYQDLLGKEVKDLKLFILLTENEGEFEVYIQEYSHLGKSGFVDLINTSNRKVFISPNLKIPILIPADKMSLQVKDDKIAELPLRGFYIKFIYENHLQKVVKTEILF